MNHVYNLSKDGITLRPVNEEDLELLRIWRNDSNNSKFLRKMPYITTEMQKRWYEQYLLDEDYVMLGIEEIEELHCLVGSVSIYNFSDGGAELGRVLIGNTEAHGKKIGVRAIRLAIEIARKQLGLNRLYLHVNPLNIPAHTIYKQAGFVDGDMDGTEVVMNISL